MKSNLKHVCGVNLDRFTAKTAPYVIFLQFNSNVMPAKRMIDGETIIILVLFREIDHPFIYINIEHFVSALREALRPARPARAA